MNTISVKDIVDGDILLYHGNSLLAELIRFFDGTDVNHASICIGNGKVGEALGHGLTTNAIPDSIKNDEYVIVKRLKTNPGTMKPVVDRAKYYLSIGNRYGFEQLVLLALLGLTRKIQVNKYLSWLLRKILDQAADWLMAHGDRQPMICSEFVYRCYDEALPAAHDPYSLDITPFPPMDRSALAGAKALATPLAMKHYHRDSLLAWAVTVASEQKQSSKFSYFHSLPAGLEKAGRRALSAEEKSLTAMSLDDLIKKYLEEAKKPASRTLDLEAALRSPEMFDSIKKFGASFYSLTYHPKTKDISSKGEAEIPAILEHLSKAVADFVTPGDLYKCDTLSNIGEVP